MRGKPGEETVIKISWLKIERGIKLKKKTRVIIVAVILVLVAVFLAGTVIFGTIENNMAQLMETPIRELNLSRIGDGTYSGEYSVFPVSAEVKVVVANNKITTIELTKHSHGQGADAERILYQVMDKQSLAVDTISGATYSSMVILKALENALAVAD